MAVNLVGSHHMEAGAELGSGLGCGCFTGGHGEGGPAVQAKRPRTEAAPVTGPHAIVVPPPSCLAKHLRNTRLGQLLKEPRAGLRPAGLAGS